MALAAVRDTSAVSAPLTHASAVVVRPVSRSEMLSGRRPRRLPAPAISVPAHSRIVLRGSTVFYR